MEFPEIREVSLNEALGRRRGATIDQIFLDQLTQKLQTLADDRALIMTVPNDVKYATFKRWVSFAAERAGVKLIIRRDPDGLRCWRELSMAQKTRQKKGASRTKDTDISHQIREEYDSKKPDK